MKAQKKVTNKQASEDDISTAFPFSVVPSKNKPINGPALECG
jgi:hypothetical protein